MVPGPKPLCTPFVKTPPCYHKCQPGYNKTFEQDKHYGEIYSLVVEGEWEINEIFLSSIRFIGKEGRKYFI